MRFEEQHGGEGRPEAGEVGVAAFRRVEILTPVSAGRPGPSAAASTFAIGQTGLGPLIGCGGFLDATLNRNAQCRRNRHPGRAKQELVAKFRVG